MIKLKFDYIENSAQRWVKWFLLYKFLWYFSANFQANHAASLFWIWTIYLKLFSDRNLINLLYEELFKKADLMFLEWFLLVVIFQHNWQWIGKEITIDSRIFSGFQSVSNFVIFLWFATRTTDAQWSLFSSKFQTFGQFNSTHFGTVSPLSMFSIKKPLFLQKKLSLHIRIPNNYLGLGFEFGMQRIRNLAIVCP